MKKIILSISAVVSSLLILSSCNLNDNTTQPQQGAFLAAQVSPTAPRVNIYVNGQTFDTGMAYGIYTPYIGVTPGTFNFKVIASGSSTPALDNNVTIDANKVYSYFIIDSFNKVKSVFVNDVFQKPSGDSVYVRFFNFCPNATEPLDVEEATSHTNIFSGRSFNDQSLNPAYASFNEIPAGTYNLNLNTISGTVLKTQSITLTGGKVYTLFAKGIQNSTDSTKALSIGLLENYPQQ